MSYCPKCGNQITEDMIFCPKCGASLKAEQTQATAQPQRPVTYRHEKEEKREKGNEKGEKHEKREKHEYAFIGPLIGGIILLFIGLSAYLSITHYIERGRLGAIFFIAIGILIVVGAIYGATMASRRHPRT